MSRFQITVNDTESGKKREYSADFYCVVANEYKKYGIASAMEGKGRAKDIVPVLMVMDRAKEEMLERRADVRFAYALLEEMFGISEEIDLLEMERQAEQMG